MTIKTRWEIRTYDVWGNARDGYDVNESYSHGEIEIDVETTTHNVGTSLEFTSAFPTDRQIKDAFGLHFNTRIETDGDDLTIYVNRERDRYPIGELFCVSHKSLSPIKPKD